MSKQAMTIIVKPASVTMHPGLIDGSKASDYHHPDVNFNIRWDTSNRRNRWPAINYVVMAFLQDNHFSVSALRFSQDRKKREPKKAPSSQIPMF